IPGSGSGSTLRWKFAWSLSRAMLGNNGTFNGFGNRVSLSRHQQIPPATTRLGISGQRHSVTAAQHPPVDGRLGWRGTEQGVVRGYNTLNGCGQ
ncbi:MAG: hypothetical protein AB7V46_09740, partial [Thermomicrobiales bacterium]